MSDTELIEQFNRDGYVVIENAFDPEEVARMQHEADAILELIVNSSIGNGRRSRRLDMVESETGRQMVRKIQPINDLSLYLAEISADERFLGPMRTLMGDEPVLMEEKLNYKEPLPDSVSGFEMTGRPTDRFPIHSEALLHGSHEVDFPLVTGRHATIFADSGMPSAVIRLMTLTAIDASVF